MSRLTDILRIDNHVVAIYRAPSVPEDADVCGPKCCIPPLLMKCNRLGTKCAADSEHITCHGAVSGLGFGGIPDRERTSCSLSRFPEGAESNHGKGKRYFANPECAMCQIDGVKDYGDGKDAIVFQDVDEAEKEGRLGVVLTCKDYLVHFYERLGFVNEGVSDSTHGGVTWYQMRLTFPSQKN